MTLTRRGFLKYSAAVSLLVLSGGLLSEMPRPASPAGKKAPAGDCLRGALGAGVWREASHGMRMGEKGGRY